MPNPLLDFSAIVQGQKDAAPSTPDRTPQTTRRERMAAKAAAPISLDDLVPDSHKPRRARASTKRRSSPLPPEFRDLDPGQALDITLYWTRTTCTCGHTFEAPKYSGSSAFARVRHRSHVSLVALLSPHSRPDLPVRIEYEEKRIHSCPECIHSHHIQHSLPLDMEPLERPVAQTRAAPSDYRHLPLSRHRYIAFRDEHPTTGAVSFAVYEEFEENGIRKLHHTHRSSAPFDELATQYPGLVQADPYPKAATLLQRPAIPVLETDDE